MFTPLQHFYQLLLFSLFFYYFIFRLGNEWYGVDIAIVEGIEKMLPIVRIPNSVAHIQGVINLRGNIIPVRYRFLSLLH